jgi:hypothetical protein
LQRSSWGLTIVALGSVIIALAALTKAIDELLIFAGAKNTEQQNEQMIARDNERARFSRDLTRAMYQRLAAMKRYFSTVEAGYSRPDQDQAWDHYATGFREWNAGLMVNVLP